MPKTNISNIDYRNLVLAKLREKSTSFSLGVIIFLVIFTFAFSQLLPKVRPFLAKVNSKDSGQIKGNKTEAEKKVRTYTVKLGDQLYLIAQEIYGSGFNMEDIMQANNITNPDSIEVGQKLIIPDVKAKFPTTGNILPSAAKTERVIDKGDRYVVKEGDTLANIALQFYGDTYAWTKIAEANNILNPFDLKKDTILIIPK